MKSFFDLLKQITIIDYTYDDYSLTIDYLLYNEPARLVSEGKQLDALMISVGLVDEVVSWKYIVDNKKMFIFDFFAENFDHKAALHTAAAYECYESTKRAIISHCRFSKVASLLKELR